MKDPFATVTELIRSMSNEDFGILARWMNEEGNRRRDLVRESLVVGTSVVWVNTTGKVVQGEVLEVGAKNAKVKSQNGGELFVPLARLALKEVYLARKRSL